VTEISPEMGYGLPKEELIVKIPRDRVPENVEVGQELQANSEEGQVATVYVKEVSNDHIIIDANHPLAGKDLVFEIEVVSLG